LCSRFCIFEKPVLEKYVSSWRKPTPTLIMHTCNPRWPSFYN
jgi:hypothetical protein